MDILEILNQLKTNGLIVVSGHRQLIRPSEITASMLALELPGKHFHLIHADGSASLADEQERSANLCGIVVTATPGAKFGEQPENAVLDSWPQGVMTRVENVRSSEPGLNIYHCCRSAGFILELFKDARASYGGAQ